MAERTFEYVKNFPNGNKAHLFRREEIKPASLETVKSYHGSWIEKQPDRVRAHRIKDYKSQFCRHILPARIDGAAFGGIYLSALGIAHLKSCKPI